MASGLAFDSGAGAFGLSAAPQSNAMFLKQQRLPLGVGAEGSTHHFYDSMTKLLQTTLTQPPEVRNQEFVEEHVNVFRQRLEHLDRLHEQQKYGRVSSSDLNTERECVESQLHSWMLLSKLRQCEDQQPPVIGGDGRFSHAVLSDRFVTSHPSLLRNLAVVAWLEEMASSRVNVEVHGQLSLTRTLRQLQHSKSDTWDPDASSRLKQPVLDREDQVEENTLLHYVWQFLRCGELEKAIELCRVFGQYWRAATLQGGQMYHSDRESKVVVGNRKRLLWKATCRKLAESNYVQPVEQAIYGLLGGSLHKVLPHCRTWEDACWLFFKKMTEDAVDQALYDELVVRGEMDERTPKPHHAGLTEASNVFDELEVAQDSNVRTSVQTIDHRVQRLLILAQYDTVVNELANYVEHSFPSSSSASSASLSPPSPFSASPSPSPFASSSSSSSSSTALILSTPNQNTSVLPPSQGSFLFFAVHLFLYLHPSCPSVSPLPPSACLLVKKLVDYLIQHKQYEFVPHYVSLLPDDQQVEVYASFLQGLDISQRHHYLEQATQYFAHNLLDIVKLLVDRLLTQSAQPPHHHHHGGGVEVSGNDMDKIRALDCFDVCDYKQNDVMVAVLTQTNVLFRYFVGTNRLAAAKKLFATTGKKALDPSHVLMADLAQISASASASDDLKFQVGNGDFHLKFDGGANLREEMLVLKNAVREYRCWRLYISCHNSYNAWSLHHHAKPLAPLPSAPLLSSSSSSSSASASASAHSSANVEMLMQAKRMEDAQRQFEMDLSHWQHTHFTLYQACWDVFNNTLTFPCGFLCDLAPEALVSPRQRDLDLIRKQCVPELVYLLYKICFDSQHYQECLSIGDLVAEEQHTLYRSFSQPETQALLKKLSRAALELSLAEEQAHHHHQQQQQQKQTQQPSDRDQHSTDYASQEEKWGAQQEERKFNTTINTTNNISTNNTINNNHTMDTSFLSSAASSSENSALYTPSSTAYNAPKSAISSRLTSRLSSGGAVIGSAVKPRTSRRVNKPVTGFGF